MKRHEVTEAVRKSKRAEEMRKCVPLTAHQLRQKQTG